MPHYTLEQVKNFSPKTLLTIINRAKDYLKKDAVMISIFKEYGLPVDDIDLIPVKFSDLDVSARTDHGIVYLNYKLLCDGDFFKDFSYLVHESTHWIQQTIGSKPTKGAGEGVYLDNPFEIEGFQNQIEWLAETFGKDEAQHYLEDMLEHHGLEGKEKEDKIKELTKKVD